MKPSEIIKLCSGRENIDWIIGLVLDQMAEDIKYLKQQVNNPFPFMSEPPKEREWEK